MLQKCICEAQYCSFKLENLASNAFSEYYPALGLWYACSHPPVILDAGLQEYASQKWAYDDVGLKILPWHGNQHRAWSHHNLGLGIVQVCYKFHITDALAQKMQSPHNSRSWRLCTHLGIDILQFIGIATFCVFLPKLQGQLLGNLYVNTVLVSQFIEDIWYTYLVQ